MRGFFYVKSVKKAKKIRHELNEFSQIILCLLLTQYLFNH